MHAVKWLPWSSAIATTPTVFSASSIAFFSITSLCLLFGCGAKQETGTVLLELSDPDAEVTVTIDGQSLNVNSAREPFEISVGEHMLEVYGPHVESFKEKITVTEGTTGFYRVDLIPLSRTTEVSGSERIALREREEKVETGSAAPRNDIVQTDVPPSEFIESNVNVSVGDDFSPPVSEELSEELSDDDLTDHERQVMEWVKTVGGSILEYNGFGIRLSRESSCTESDFERFQHLPHLHTLGLHGWMPGGWIEGLELGDRSLLQLVDLPKLRVFGARGMQITDRSLEHLAGFPITDLTIQYAAITDEGIAHFSKHALRSVSLDRCANVADDGLIKLQFEEINSFRLIGTQVSDRFARELQRCPNLTILTLKDTRVTGDGLTSLRGHDKLIQLNLHNLQIGDAHLAHVVGNTQLSQLRLGRTQVTANGLQLIANSFPNLDLLDVPGLEIPQHAAIDWSGLKKLRILVFRYSHVGPRQLEAIASLPNLQQLYITIDSKYFHASRQALLAFQRVRPQCTINDKRVDELLWDLSEK